MKNLSLCFLSLFVAYSVLCMNTDTRLHEAVDNNNVEEVLTLLENGCDPNLCDKNKDTALHRAARKGYLDIIEVLIQNNARIDLRNRLDDTPLIETASEGHLKAVKLLHKKGADIHAENRLGESALYWARAFKHTDVENYLKDRNARIGPFLEFLDSGIFDPENMGFHLNDNGKVFIVIKDRH